MLHTLFCMESARVSFCASSQSRVTTLSAALLIGSRSSTCSNKVFHLMPLSQNSTNG